MGWQNMVPKVESLNTKQMRRSPGLPIAFALPPSKLRFNPTLNPYFPYPRPALPPTPTARSSFYILHTFTHDIGSQIGPHPMNIHLKWIKWKYEYKKAKAYFHIINFYIINKEEPIKILFKLILVPHSINVQNMI